MIYRNIQEYDIRSAGPNLLFSNDLMSMEQYRGIVDVADKHERQVKFGLFLRDNNKGAVLEKLFKETMNEFIESNNLEEHEIVDIKKDAIFTTKCCFNLKFKKTIEFINKNSFDFMVKLDNPIEFYISSDGRCFFKGIKAPDNEFLYDSIKGILKRYERGKNVLRYISDFKERYFNKELNIELYREFSINNGFRFNLYDSRFLYLKKVQDLESVDVNYNWNMIFYPLFREIMREVI